MKACPRTRRSFEFEWDDKKALTNEQKHGVRFDEAKSCFLDVFAVQSFDVDHSDGEDRFVVMGMSDREAFTAPDHATIRIVSARKALKKERFHYEENTSR